MMTETERWLKKEEQKEEIGRDELEDLHDICTLVANDLLDALHYEYELDTDKIEFTADIVFFFEALKGMVLKTAGHWHPFQDLSEEFFKANGVTVEETADGNYKFVIGDGADEDSINEITDSGEDA